MRKVLLLIMSFTCSIGISMGQEKTISGTVTSAESGEVLPGVNIRVKGSTQGTITNIDGEYTIQMPSGENTLIFSFIGFTSEQIDVGNMSVVDVALQSDVKQLSEVVVTAIGVEKQRKSIGYAVSEVDKQQLQRKAEPDVLRAMQGKVAGVEIIGQNGAPGSASQITIRGYTTTGSNQPLIIVDGVPFNNDLNVTSNPLSGGSTPSNRLADINPDDIESMTVLKGASASVLYGSRAANGVILITTKSGSASLGNQKGLEITVNSSFNIEEVQGLPDYQNIYGQGANFDYDGGFFGTWGPAFSQLDSVPHHFSGSDYAAIFPELQGKNVPYQAYPNNVRDFYDQGTIFENSVSLASGGEVGSFNLSYARTDHDGFIPGSSFERNNFSVGGRYNLENGIVAGGNMNYMNSNQQGIQAGGGAAGASPVHTQLWYIPRSYDLIGYPYANPQNGDNIFYRDGLDNPIWNARNNIYESDVDRIWGNLFALYDVTDWLTLNYKVGYNSYNDRRSNFIEVSSTINPTTYNREGGITLDNIFSEEIDHNFFAEFTKTLATDFDLRLLAGYNYNIRNFDRQSNIGTDLISRNIRDIDNTANVEPNGGGISRRRFAGLYGDLTVSYKGWAFINYQARNDWSSTLPEDSRSFFYQGINGSFVFTDAFNINSNLITLGKIRAGWGKVGRDATPYAVSQVYETNEGFGNNIAAISLPFLGTSGLFVDDDLANPTLTPEFTTEFEIGADLGLLNNQINIDFTYYNKTTTDLLIAVQVPASSGYLSRLSNAGELSNEGFEVGLDLTPIRTADFNWNIYTAFTRNVSKVESLADEQEILGIGFGFTGDFGAYLKRGSQYGVIQGSAYARDDEGNYLIDPATGWPIATQESVPIADPNRDFTIGFTNSFTYKGITLTALVDWMKGGEFYSATAANLLGRGVLGITAENRETPRVLPGVLGDPDTQTPILDESGNTIVNDIQITANEYWWRGIGSAAPQEAYVFDATVVKLRELSIGYDLPNNLLSKTPFGSASISLVGRNLWFFAPNFPEGSGIDPDHGGSQLGNVRGFDFAYIPNARRYGVNLRFTF